MPKGHPEPKGHFNVDLHFRVYGETAERLQDMAKTQGTAVNVIARLLVHAAIADDVKRESVESVINHSLYGIRQRILKDVSLHMEEIAESLRAEAAAIEMADPT